MEATQVRLPPPSLSINTNINPTSSFQSVGPTSPLRPWGGFGLRSGMRWCDASPTSSVGCASPMALSSIATPKAMSSTMTAVPEKRASIIGSTSIIASTPTGTARTRMGQTFVRRGSLDSTNPQSERRPSIDGTAQVLRPATELSRGVPVQPTKARWADILDMDDTPMNAPVQPVLSRESSRQSQSEVPVRPTEIPVRPAVVQAPIRRWADFSPDGTNTANSPTGAAFSFHMASKTPSPAQSPVSSPRETPPQEESDEDDDWLVPIDNRWKNYPTSPCNLDTRTQATGSEPRIGIDIGGVLTREGDPSIDRNREWDLDWEAAGGFNVVWQIVQVFGAQNTFIVSKVKLESSMHRQIEHWLHEVCKFCEITGFLKENIVFVSSMNGPNGKGNAAAKLGLSHFIDDKIECLESVWNDPFGNTGPIVERFKGTLFHFAKGGWSSTPPSCDVESLHPRMQQHYCGVANWAEVQENLRLRLKGSLQKRAEEILVPGNLMPIDPALERGVAKPLFNSMARAKDERPPWFHSTSPTAVRASSANPSAALQWNTEENRPKLKLKPRTTVSPDPKPIQASSPTANRAQSARPDLQLTEGGRPKLVLKPRTTGGVIQEAPTNRNPIACTSPKNGNPIVCTSPKNARVIGGGIDMSPKNTGPVIVAPAVATQPVELVQQTTQATTISRSALQQDPSGGRPKLMLKPRSTPGTTAFCKDVNEKMRSS